MNRPVIERVIVGGRRTATAQLERACAPKTGQTGQTGQWVENAWEFGAFSGQKPPSHDSKLASAPVQDGVEGVDRPINAVQRMPPL
jgi:hypothetical protein